MTYRLLALLHLLALAASGAESGLQTAIREAIADGTRDIVLPLGSMTVREPLIIDAAQELRLIGQDAENVALIAHPDLANRPMLVLRGGSGVRLERITFRGHAAATGPLVEIEGSDRAVITRCFFETHGGPGLRITDSTATQVRENSLRDLDLGVDLTGSTADATVENNHLARCRVGLQIGSDTRNGNLRGNELRHCATAIQPPTAALPDANAIEPPPTEAQRLKHPAPGSNGSATDPARDATGKTLEHPPPPTGAPKPQPETPPQR
ncbi:MAG: right-handed parallel beta-helix repeat-containing protein [Verrucomicrobiales bacterium]|nr:right-handed parallel beta-helix repeat-containing protein [Verrucomicrobiales bacterium]